ncbi:glycosyltransferase [Streptomyces sp. NPDC005393]|uniref:glycosyltransferase n=1 Tax=Streptomyces sp. NPDC005393 TaxID=3157041 RepID=UPI0033A5A24A
MTERRQRILAVCTRSGLGKGGLPVFNWQLCEALANNHSVTLLTTQPDTPPHEGVTVLHTPAPPPMAGEGSEPWEERVWLEWCAQHDPRGFGLPGSHERPFDLIIGHSRFSGPAAAQLRERWYPDAKLAHFLHTSPEKLPYAKYPDAPQHAAFKAQRDLSLELEFMGRSDIVIGVGPLLTNEADRVTSSVQLKPSVHELIPGTQIDQPVTHGASQGRLNLLVMGRVDDPLKGVKDAAIAVNKLNEAGVSTHLTILGADAQTLAQAKEEFAALAGAENVEVKAFIRDPNELRAEVRRADAVMMPSKHEGFGLVATEALGHGIPVLVNQESGAAQFLGDQNRIPASLGSPCIVQEPPPGVERAEMWVSAIADLKEDLPQRREAALQLRQELQQYSWENASESFIQVTREAVHIQERRTSQTRQTSLTTVQGPAGTVLPSDAPKAQTADRQSSTQAPVQETAHNKGPQARTQSQQSPQPAGPMTVEQIAALRSAKMPNPAKRTAQQGTHGTQGTTVPRQSPMPHTRQGPGPTPGAGGAPGR